MESKVTVSRDKKNVYLTLTEVTGKIKDVAEFSPEDAIACGEQLIFSGMFIKGGWGNTNK